MVKDEDKKEKTLEAIFTYPTSGEKKTLPYLADHPNINTIDFWDGELKFADGSDAQLHTSLRARGMGHCRSIHLEIETANCDIKFEGEETWYRIYAPDFFEISRTPFRKIYLRPRAANCAIWFFASSSETGASTSLGKKKLEEIKDGLDGDYDPDADSLHDLKAALDTIDTVVDAISDAVDVVDALLDKPRRFGFISEAIPPAQHPGTAYYVDGENGDNGNDGLSLTNAVATIDYAVGLATANQDDWIFVNYKSTVYDENALAGGVIVDKAGLHLIGLYGYGSVRVENSKADATSVFLVSVNNVEIAGFAITEATNTVEGIVFQSSLDSKIHDNIFTTTLENAIACLSGYSQARIEIYNNKILNSTNDGIELAYSATGSCVNCHIHNNYFYNVGDNAIHINGDVSDGHYVHDNIINGNAGTTSIGINVALGDNNIIVNNWIGGCVSPISDTGDGNVWDCWFDKITGSFTMEVGDGTSETDKVTNIDMPCSGKFVIEIDRTATDADAGTVTMRAYTKTDLSNYQIRDKSTFLIGTDEVEPTLEISTEGGDSKVKISSQITAAVGAQRTIFYKIVRV